LTDNNLKKNPAFGGLDTRYSDKENSDIFILPVPFDKTSTWGKGADKGPDAIIEASANMELYDIETDSEVFLRGIYTAPPVLEEEPEKMVNSVYERVTSYLGNNKFVVTLGGEHTVSLGAARAHLDKYPDMTILHLDAHADMRNEYMGSQYNHACVAARFRDAFVRTVSVGIRSMDKSETSGIPRDDIFFARDILKTREWIGPISYRLAEEVYITLDLDVFDPSIIPSTGTPEPGGLDWYMITSLIKHISKVKRICGFDIVELCPSSDNKAPDFTAAKLIYKILSYIYHGA